MFRIPVPKMLGFIVTVMVGLSTLAADELDEAIAREEALERELATINQGQLEFLPGAPEVAVHTHGNRIRIDADSLRHGWVGFEQCHDQLDRVATAEIVFHPDDVRNLAVTEYAHIGRVIIDGSRVQLEQIGEGARLCVTAQSRSLHSVGDGRFVLRHGPYMRRFLDGYYPLHVRMEIAWPEGVLDYVGTHPAAQPGFDVEGGRGTLSVDAWFRGRLSTEILFRDARVSWLP